MPISILLNRQGRNRYDVQRSYGSPATRTTKRNYVIEHNKARRCYCNNNYAIYQQFRSIASSDKTHRRRQRFRLASGDGYDKSTTNCVVASR